MLLRNVKILVHRLLLFFTGSLTFVNCWKVELAAKVQNVFTVAKLFALGIVILVGAYQLFLGEIIIFYGFIF